MTNERERQTYFGAVNIATGHLLRLIIYLNSLLIVKSLISLNFVVTANSHKSNRVATCLVFNICLI
jgi:hypothetical protein